MNTCSYCAKEQAEIMEQLRQVLDCLHDVVGMAGIDEDHLQEARRHLHRASLLLGGWKGPSVVTVDWSQVQEVEF